MKMGSMMDRINEYEYSFVDDFMNYLEQRSRSMPAPLPEWVS